MASTVLEATRAAHEDLERLERLAVRELQREPANARGRLFQSHRVRHMLDLVISTSDKLVEIYEDKDNARKDEISIHLTAPTQNGIFSKYYERLKEIRDYHRKNPSARFVSTTDDYEELLKEEPVIEFTGEEAFGRYLDLHELYNEFINSKFGTQIEYSTYVGTFTQTEKIPRSHKATRQYREYLEHVLEYLTSFIYRTEPLQDIEKIFAKLEGEFEERWTNGEVPGWEKESMSQWSEINLDEYNTVEELVELGLQKLKEALAAHGLKSGGTVQQRAERLFLLKNTPLEQMDRKHFAKVPRTLNVSSESFTDNGFKDDLKETALLEAKMKRLCELLDEVIVRTKENAEKKLTLTYEEMEAEREEEEVQPDTESDDEDQQIYNPLKLPMGWDGKPIPYWLYKLHGLGQEFKCEICGNHSYWGRRAYERHFKEWRHQHGMRCLGIPNTKNFNEITSIEEAKALWEKIQARQGVIKWRPELEEEYEDQEAFLSCPDHSATGSSRRSPPAQAGAPSSSPALVSSVQDLYDFICSGPLVDKIGYTKEKIAESIDRWLIAGSHVARMFRLNELQLSEAEKARIYHYYIPVFLWCEDQVVEHRAKYEGDDIPALVIGFSAPQGSGKTTLVFALDFLFRVAGRNSVTLSIDDFYLTAEEQKQLRENNPGNDLLELRGNAGSHDLQLSIDTLESLSKLTKKDTKMKVPRYDKSAYGGRGDRADPSTWPEVEGPLEVVLFEGWMLGFKPLPNEVVKAVDPQLEVVNKNLQAYYDAWDRFIKSWIVIKIKEPNCVYQWRLQAEIAMKADGKPGMSDEEVMDFVSRYLPAYRAYLPTLYKEGPNGSDPDHLLVIDIDEERNPILGQLNSADVQLKWNF